MGTALSVAAVVVAVASAIFAFQSRRAADRSASAAESADLRDREPRLTITLNALTPAPGDRVIYTLRNDGPQDLDSVVVYKPRTADRITYPIAHTGGNAGWANDEVDLGPLPVTAEERFTLCCGTAVDLPEYRVRIHCKAGKDSWLMGQRLPAPRGEPLSDEVKALRREVLTGAIEEIERNIRTAGGAHWSTVPLEVEYLKSAHRLLREHAPDWIGPVRDALDEVAAFQAWVTASQGTTVRDELQGHREAVAARLSAAHAEINNMRDALVRRQASGREWRS